MIQLKSDKDLDRMRWAGRHVAEILLSVRKLVEPGQTTADFDRAAHEEIRRRGLESSFLGYGPGGARPFPAVICTSLNDEVVHGMSAYSPTVFPRIMFVSFDHRKWIFFRLSPRKKGT